MIAYNKNGKALAEESVRTAGKPDHLVLEADRNALTADGKDLSYITVKIVDKDGHFCPDAVNELKFEVSVAGQYKVVANGDATSLNPFHLNHMKAFQGMLVVTVQASAQVGEIRLDVSGKHLKRSRIVIATGLQ